MRELCIRCDLFDQTTWAPEEADKLFADMCSHLDAGVRPR